MDANGYQNFGDLVTKSFIHQLRFCKRLSSVIVSLTRSSSERMIIEARVKLIRQ